MSEEIQSAEFGSFRKQEIKRRETSVNEQVSLSVVQEQDNEGGNHIWMEPEDVMNSAKRILRDNCY